MNSIIISIPKKYYKKNTNKKENSIKIITKEEQNYITIDKNMIIINNFICWIK
jgi:hypothetical protein